MATTSHALSTHQPLTERLLFYPCFRSIFALYVILHKDPMRLAFIPTQTPTGSTNIGRIFPLARELAQNHEVHVLVHRGQQKPVTENFKIHVTGRDPFARTATGKKRLRGIALIGRLKINILRAMFTLLRLKPDIVIISKSLPESVLAAWLYSKLRRTRFILDVDDFELTANKLTSLAQRAAVHWAERAGAKLAEVIITATPFLNDHFEQLTRDSKKVVMIATGIAAPAGKTPGVSALTPGVKEAGARLLYLGSISLGSGHRVDLLPEILQRVRQEFPATHLTIAGDGDDVESLRQQFEHAGVSRAVTWHGRFSPSEVEALLNNAALVIDPVDDSITNRAKSSSRTLFAASAGRAIVTSNIGIRPYLLPDQLHERFFATPGSARSYAEKVVAALKQPLTHSEQVLLRECASSFAWPKLTRRFAEALKL